jgi:hypothetical protein
MRRKALTSSPVTGRIVASWGRVLGRGGILNPEVGFVAKSGALKVGGGAAVAAAGGGGGGGLATV